jgi:CO dehydrogenase/acetyl-CoA synthase epsilon subunit
MEYTPEDFKTAKEKYKSGMVVKSPMTGKEFTIEEVKETWHKEYIKGYDGSMFYDVVWFMGVFAEIVHSTCGK